MKSRGEGPFTINMQDILEEISDTIWRTSLGMLTRVVFMGKKLSLVLMGKSQFGGTRSCWKLSHFGVACWRIRHKKQRKCVCWKWKRFNDTLEDVKEAEDNRAYVREIELVLMRTWFAAGIPFLASTHNIGFFNGPAGFNR